MNLLILGSCGFIGSNLCSFFTSRQYNVTGCDLVEYSTLEYRYHKISILSSDFETLFGEYQFDVCINASGSGNVGYSIAHPQSDFDANTIALAKVLDVIRKYQPLCKLLHISSAAVYGNPDSLPVCESAALKPLSPYGYHKLMSELLCSEYAIIYNIQVLVIRPFSVYGNGLKKQLLWDICQKLLQADTIELFGTGNETRDFIHINDMVKLIDLLIGKAAFHGSILNVGSGVQSSIHNIAQLFMQHFPGNKQIVFSGTGKKGDPANWLADISKIRALGFIPVQILDEQVQSYINWYCSIHS